MNIAKKRPYTQYSNKVFLRTQNFDFEQIKCNWSKMFKKNYLIESRVEPNLDKSKFNYVLNKGITLERMGARNKSNISTVANNSRGSVMSPYKWSDTKKHFDTINIMKIKRNNSRKVMRTEGDTVSNKTIYFDKAYNDIFSVERTSHDKIYNKHKHKKSLSKLVKIAKEKSDFMENISKTINFIEPSYKKYSNSSLAKKNSRLTQETSLLADYINTRNETVFTPIKKHSSKNYIEDNKLELLKTQFNLDPNTDGKTITKLLRSELDDYIIGRLKTEIDVYRKSDIKMLEGSELEDFKAKFRAKKPYSKKYIRELLIKISFFETLKFTQQLEIIEGSEYKQFNKGDIIITSNNIQDIYFIIEGKVIANANRKLIQKIHQGQFFFRKLIVNSEVFKNDVFTLVAKYNTKLMIIPITLFNEIIYKDEEQLYYEKLYAVKSSSIFNNIPISELLVFVLKLKIIEKKFSEIIIKQGEIQKNCYIVCSGICRLYIEYRPNKSNHPIIYLRDSQISQPSAFRFSSFITSGMRPHCKSTFNNRNVKPSSQVFLNIIIVYINW